MKVGDQFPRYIYEHIIDVSETNNGSKTEPTTGGAPKQTPGVRQNKQREGATQTAGVNQNKQWEGMGGGHMVMNVQRV